MPENTRRILDQQEATSLSGDDFLVADNANLGTRKISYERLLSGATPLPPNYLTGFVITKTGNTTFSVSSGYARSMDNVRNIVLNNVINKNLSSFVVGDGGSMPDRLSAQQNKTYYVFALVNSGGLVDIILDTNINCINGLADATVQANNFNKWARIGEIRTRSNAIEIVNPISYSIDFHDLKIRDLKIVPENNDVEGGEIEFVSAPNEVNAGKRMWIDRYEGKIRIVAVSSNNTIRELLNADAEFGDVEGNIGKTGMIYSFGGNFVPEGFLPCNGAAVSRTVYSRLFNVIGTTWGAGDGSTTFNLPNCPNMRIVRGTSLPIAGNGYGLTLDNGTYFFSISQDAASSSTAIAAARPQGVPIGTATTRLEDTVAKVLGVPTVDRIVSVSQGLEKTGLITYLGNSVQVNLFIKY